MFKASFSYECYQGELLQGKFELRQVVIKASCYQGKLLLGKFEQGEFELGEFVQGEFVQGKLLLSPCKFISEILAGT